MICRFDVIVDPLVAHRSPRFHLDLLASRRGATYVTVTSPLMQNADNHGLVLGGVKSAFKLGRHALEVRVGRAEDWASRERGWVGRGRPASEVNRGQGWNAVDRKGRAGPRGPSQVRHLRCGTSGFIRN